MSTQYLREHQTRATPQSDPMREDQAENSAGGFVWEVDDWTLARRFLVLGTEGGTYYIGEHELTRSAARAVERCIEADGLRAVKMIRDVSDGGLAAKNDPALFALAMATAAADVETRREAWRSLPTVARTGTHLLHFCAFREQFGGWGRAAARGVAEWYAGKPVADLAYQVVKYRQRDGWTHRDVLRVAHPGPPRSAPATVDQRVLYDFICGREPSTDDRVPEALRIVDGFLQAQSAESPAASARLIAEYGLPREAVRTEHLREPEVWEALLRDMPMGAMVRNLANLTRVGVLAPMSEAAALVCERLADGERLRRARVHPISLLSAMKVYSQGHGELGRGEPWNPVPQVVDALDAAFYLAFESVEPASKRTLLALDVSGSMKGQPVNGLAGITARDGAAAMALVTAAREPLYDAVAFAGPYVERRHTIMGRAESSQRNGLIPFPLSSRERLDDVMRRMRETPFGPTDCALPMVYAMENGIDVDTFQVYTDSETFAGDVHPMQALRRYRERTGINARLIVVGMASNGFTIADPGDAGSLDVVGFDASAPATMAAFSRGEV